MNVLKITVFLSFILLWSSAIYAKDTYTQPPVKLSSKKMVEPVKVHGEEWDSSGYYRVEDKTEASRDVASDNEDEAKWERHPSSNPEPKKMEDESERPLYWKYKSDLAK